MKPLERRQLANASGRTECIACGGSGEKSRTNGTNIACVACGGTGSKRTIAVAQHSAATVEHYTPSHIVDAAHKVMGGIDLDPASCALAQKVVDAHAWYGPGSELGEDGLAEPWGGRVFLNPPGGNVPDEYKGMGTKSNAALWWGRLASAWREGEIDQAIFVGFTLEILRSAQALDVPQPLAFAICVPKSRIKFDTVVDGERVASTSPTHANVIVYLPPAVGAEHIRGFFEAFATLGACASMPSSRTARCSPDLWDVPEYR